MTAIVSPAWTDTRTSFAADALLSAVATAAMLALHAVRGFPTLAASNGDNDSLMRLVQVRDLLAGQGWFDLHQYRMGFEGGLEIHWSRLVDLPLAALVAIFGETAAITIWPTLLFGVGLLLILRAARVVGGAAAVPPALVVGGLALYFINQFPPGTVDHHNVQLTLALAALLCLLRSRDAAAAPAIAGLCAGLMLAVGMEAAPYVAAAGGLAAMLFLVKGEEEARLARGFGIGFAGVAALAFGATVPAGEWTSVQCDAFSLPQVSLAVLGGGGLAAIASLRLSGRGRAVALGGLAVAAALLAATAFPQCLADPYAGLDPRLKRYWLDAVSEAQPATAILMSRPAIFAGFYITPVLALGLLGWKLARREADRRHVVLAAFLATAVGVSLWQVRGAMFSLPIAAIALAAWIAVARTRAVAEGTPAAVLTMAAAWLLSVNMVWQLAVAVMVPQRLEDAADGGEAASKCYARADYAPLARLPAGTVLAISNLGSSILSQTSHRALAGPYHRNVAGNLATLDMLMGSPETARTLAKAADVDYLLVCPGNAETTSIARWAPEGLLAQIVEGSVPRWLELVPETRDQPIVVYRLRP